ncbi:MAG: hypothetical protein Kow0042_21830 [Calditrichia bacterium]
MFRKIRDRFIKPSTRAFSAEARKLSGFSLFDWFHGYLYARWPYLYIGVGTGEHRLSRVLAPSWNFLSRLCGTSRNGAQTFADGYHGKVITVESAARLVQVNREIEIRNLEQVLPYSKAKDIVLQHPDHIAVLECPCRASRKNPCQPLDVCLIVGEPFASFILEHHPQKARKITRQEALEILREEHLRGHVHHAFFKDAMLGRFYAICNCCSCCCGAMQAHRNGTPMLASSGYVSEVDAVLCIGCGDCMQMCPFGALELVEDMAQVNREKCMGCGVCVDLCPREAPSLVRDNARPEPLEINRLMEQALHGTLAGVGK